MKPVWILLYVVTFIAGQTLGQAQTLAPVEAAGGLGWPLIIVAIIVAAIVGFVIWHKRNPSAANAAATTAASDAVALGHKALDLAAGLRDTITKQAGVIAQQSAVVTSPPVQAVINAPQAAAPPPAASVAAAPPPAASVAAAPATGAPTAVPAPAPVTATGTTADPAAPWGYTTGPNGKVANTGPDVGFGYDPFGVPMESQAVAEHWKNLMGWQASREVPSMSDAESNAVLQTFDAEPSVWVKWYHISAKEQLALVNRTTQASIGAMINEYNGANGRNIGVPPGWADSACHRLRGD